MTSSDATSGLAPIIARNLKAARREAGLTQHDVAVRLGRGDAMTISRWERAKNKPSDENLIALAQLFGCDVAWFYSTAPDPEDIAA